MDLEKVLQDYENYDSPIDIERIVNSFGIKIIKMDLWKVDWLLFENFIWVNKKLHKFKQRFVIAHEFCHFILWEKWFSKWIYHSTDPKEKRADDFATQILLPKNQIKEKYFEFENIPTLAQYFWVPEKVVEKRLNNLFYNKKLYVRS